jgi:putative addiction module component (TIGR02574 family)
MSPRNLAMAEEALSLSAKERAELAKLLIQSLEGDSRSDKEITEELKRRLEELLSGKDSGLSFEQVFNESE